MKTIKILGTGCPNCTRTEAIVKKVVDELQLEANIIKVEDIQEIMAYDIMSTPAIVIDETVVIKGRVPSFEEIKNLLTNDTCCSSENDSCEPQEDDNSSSCCCS